MISSLNILSKFKTLNFILLCPQCVLHPRIRTSEGRASPALPFPLPGRHSHGPSRGCIQAGRIRARCWSGVREERPDTHVRAPSPGQCRASNWSIDESTVPGGAPGAYKLVRTRCRSGVREKRPDTHVRAPSPGQFRASNLDESTVPGGASCAYKLGEFTSWSGYCEELPNSHVRAPSSGLSCVELNNRITTVPGGA